MRNRFFIDADLNPDAVMTLDEEERHHARVVRVRDGEEVEVFNGRGASFNAMYESGALRLTTPTANREPRTAIHLAMAIIQLDKFELVLQKATELGVASIIPTITERCEVRPERFRGKGERWEKIVFEAVKQSGRSRMPALEPPTTFEAVLSRDGAKIIFDADAEPTTSDVNEAITLIVGPEGGWTDRELQLARDHRCAFRRLGSRRLRAETAAIAAVALIAAEAGDI